MDQTIEINKIKNNEQIIEKVSGPKWTDEQLAAIETSGCNLLVAAAAGSGKTAVLVERIIRKIVREENPVDIDRLLVVTFTNAAAAEMRERIAAALTKALEERPESKQLQKQLALLHKASITTIHSFCLEVIKNNFHLIDLDPGFRIADTTEELLLKLEVLDELFEEKYLAENLEEVFLDLVESYGGNTDDSKLQEMVLNLYDYVQSAPWPEAWLKEKVEYFKVSQELDFAETSWGKILIHSTKKELEGLIPILQKAIDIASEDEGLFPYLDNLNEEIAGIQRLVHKCGDSWDELQEEFNQFKFKTLSRCKKDADKNKQEIVKDLRSQVKDAFNKIKNENFRFLSREIISDLNRLYPLMKCLAKLTIEFGEKYSAKKKEKGLVDFNDLEHYCLNILTEVDENGNLQASKTAIELQEKYEEILIDEYQDSNMVQEVIMQTISRQHTDAPNVFMVGDVKQSIYRFRQARPELFLKKYSQYSQQEGDPERKILLYKNFRSRREIVDSVNFVFSQIMSFDVGELDYNEKEALNFGASYGEANDEESVIGGEVELHLIDTEAQETSLNQSGEEESAYRGEDFNDDEEEPDKIQLEARVIAKRIQQFRQADKDGRFFKVFDKNLNQYRKVEYKDIVILLRATQNWAEVFVEELAAYGIPAYADTGNGYFKTIEVQTMLSLLQIIDNPMQDIPLLAVLRSPIVSFSAEELAEIRIADPRGSFYEAMKVIASQEDKSALSEKTSAFLEKLKAWREKASYTPTDELIWFLYNDTGYFSFVGAMQGGLQRQANLRLLFERAKQYEETSYKGLFNFIRFINKLKTSQGDMGSAKILGEGENVVRIMSIHKSKGLEFPIVFVAGTGKKFNMQDLNGSILLHQDLGLGPKVVDHEKRIYYPSLCQEALKSKIRLETLSEEMRILYVAFTRAKEKLIITGTVKNIEKTVLNWMGILSQQEIKLPSYEISKGKNYLDWIAMSLIRHKDGEALRAIAGIAENHQYHLLEHNSKWSIKVWNKNSLFGKQDESEAIDIESSEENAAVEHSPYRDEIHRRLSWRYLYELASKVPSKISVTELKHYFNTEVSDEYGVPIFIPHLMPKPKFMEEKTKLTGAERGSILHFVMQHLDLAHVTTSEAIQEQLVRMIANELITEQQAQTVQINKIVRFFKSPFGQRMLKSTEIKREVPFYIELNCSELYKDMQDDPYCKETVLLQGVIDCYFQEPDGLVLLDYKTDYIPGGNVNIIKERYQIQLDYYEIALKKITGKAVKEKYIYLFSNEQILKI